MMARRTRFDRTKLDRLDLMVDDLINSRLLMVLLVLFDYQVPRIVMELYNINRRREKIKNKIRKKIAQFKKNLAVLFQFSSDQQRYLIDHFQIKLLIFHKILLVPLTSVDDFVEVFQNNLMKKRAFFQHDQFQNLGISYMLNIEK